MWKRLCIFGLSFLVWLSVDMYGAIKKLTDDTAFSSDAVRLFVGTDLLSLATPGAAAGDLFQAFGITMSSTGPFRPVIDITPLLDPGGPPPPLPGNRLLFVWNRRKDGNPSSRDDIPLVVDFRFPVKRVLFDVLPYLQGRAIVTGFGPDGTLLGSVEKLAGEPDIGIETDDEEGIAKVAISSQTDSPETVVRMTLDYAVPALFTTYVPHLATGSSEGSEIKTSISILNLSNSTATGSVAFLDNDGKPLNLVVDGSRLSVLEFELAPLRSRQFDLGKPPETPDGIFLTGYARLRSNLPLEASVIFRTWDGGGGPQEAGISSTAPYFTASGAVTVDLEKAENTAIALVNESTDEACQVDLILMGKSGEEAVFERSVIVLNPGEHTAQFIQELLPSVAGRNLAGSLMIQGRNRVASTVLKSLHGVAVASLPVGSTEKSSVR